ncbi:hypothetical protein EDB89DRAFT_852680 [Lactarius sanguifluus]|nr:hypothetical protein EDB89DRAFT_852680 [Lactarius sanguifluus]
MDPFVVVSFGKKVFRTRVIWHSLNLCGESYFCSCAKTSSFRMRPTPLDRDKLPFNDFVADAIDLAANVPKKDPGFYPEEEDGPRTFQHFSSKGLKRTPTIAFRAKYQLYDALWQRLWSQLLKQCDANDTRTVMRLELTPSYSVRHCLPETIILHALEQEFLEGQAHVPQGDPVP